MKDITYSSTCDWCGTGLDYLGLCKKCQIIKQHSLILGREVAQLTAKGGCQLYVGIERTGQETKLLSVKRWSPLESLEELCQQ